MAFKVLIGRQTKGGNTQQQADAVELASADLEIQLNAPELGVDSIQAAFINDFSPLYTEIIAIVKTSDIKKKGV